MGYRIYDIITIQIHIIIEIRIDVHVKSLLKQTLILKAEITPTNNYCSGTSGDSNETDNDKVTTSINC